MKDATSVAVGVVMVVAHTAELGAGVKRGWKGAGKVGYEDGARQVGCYDGTRQVG